MPTSSFKSAGITNNSCKSQLEYQVLISDTTKILMVYHNTSNVKKV